MSTYVDRCGQRVGPWTVEADAGRTKRGEVLWRCRHASGQVKHFRTYRVIELARKHNAPRPGWIAN